MKKITAKLAAATVFAATAYAGMGDILASWQTPWPHRGVNGIVYDGEYIWVKNTNSYEGWVFKCTTNGSVVTEIAFPYPAPSFYSYGLTFDGEYLWTIYQYWRWGITYHDDYRKYTTTGSYAGGFSLQVWPWAHSKAITWDGKYLYTDELRPGQERIGKYTTAGTLVATFPMTVGVGSDMAYYRRQLWYRSGGGFVHGVTLNGSVVASFPAPGGSCYAVGFDGEYLWTADTNKPQYIYKVDIEVVDVNPDSLGKIKSLYR